MGLQTTVPSIDDKEDMIYADDYEVYDIFGFTNEELYNIYKITTFCQPKLNAGNEWVSKGQTKLVPWLPALSLVLAIKSMRTCSCTL